MAMVLVANMPPITEGIDPEPGNYFVSCIRDNGDASLVSGPYPTHQAALADVQTVRRIAEDVADDAHVIWYRWGTCRLKSTSTVVGVLQKAGVYELPNDNEPEPDYASVRPHNLHCKLRKW